MSVEHCLACPWCTGDQQLADGAAVLECSLPARSAVAPVSADLVELLHRTQVDAIMAHRVTCIDADLDLNEAATILARAHLHTAPVVEDSGILIGVVTRGDVLRAGEHGGDGQPLSPMRMPLESAGLLVEDVMTVAVVRLPESASLADAARLFADSGAHRLPVVSRADVVVGMLSAMDVVRWLSAHLTSKVSSVALAARPVRDEHR